MTDLRHPPAVLPGQRVSLALHGNNRGVAAFYYPWSVEWALIDAGDNVVATQKTKWDIRSWQPGSFQESAELSFNAPAGQYRLAIGIRDPWQNQMAIQFANRLDVIDGWTVVSKLKIGR